jgi:hypothetical protein
MSHRATTILAGILCVGLLAPVAAFAGASSSADDPGVYFEPSSSFFFRYSLTTGLPEASAFITNVPGWIQVSGDWDGDGVDGIGVYNTTTGTWFLVDDVVDSPAMALPADYTAFIDPVGIDWEPITGNWDGVGGDGIGIYNKTSGTMFLVNDPTQGANSASPADYTVFMDTNGPAWIPITGAWNGADNDGVGIYNKTTGTMFLVNDATLGGVAPADYTIFMNPDGQSWLPVAGDWNGDDFDGVGIWNKTTGAFFLADDATQGVGSGAAPADVSFFMDGDSSPLGGPGFSPIMGDWDGPL